MCGFNAILSFNDKLANANDTIHAMNNAIAHRGPNSEGIYTSDFVNLGHRRLSIIDLSDAGKQPMTSSCGNYILVFNGEIYNFQEVKFELQRVEFGDNKSYEDLYVFNTQTDSEVIIAAYKKWGEACVHKFNGMFAFVIYDIQKQNCFIARDRLGIKPIYYSIQNNHILLSSEIRAILASGLVPKSLNEEAITEYIQYQTVYAPNTILKHVSMMMPGTSCTADLKSITSFQPKSYWTLGNPLNTVNKERGSDYNAIKKSVKELLLQAVERRLVADVPFGAFLSGGIDSSAIVALMSECSNNVNTFCISFDESEFSEAKYAQTVADKYKTNHHEIKLSVNDFLHDLPNALNSFDHPSADGPNTYVVSKATKQAGITMALSGLGGDELFAGYDFFKRLLSIQQKSYVNAIPQPLRKLGGFAYKKYNSSVAGEKMYELSGLDSISLSTAYPLMRKVLSNEDAKNICTNYRSSTFYPNLSREINKRKGSITQTSFADMSSYMQNILLRDTDQMSMAHALEVRVPFLDYALVDYVLALPDQIKFPSTPKKLLVDSMGDLLPSDIVNRKKMGFTLPWEQWMKNELKAFCETRIQSLAQRPQFHEAFVMAMWKAFLNGNKKYTWSRVWHLVVLENYLQKTID